MNHTFSHTLVRLAARVPLLATAVTILISAAVGVDTTSAARGAGTYNFLVGTGDICSLDPSFCPEISSAPNGDTLTITGQGTFTAPNGDASGGGTFTHKDAAGNTLASGTWTALHASSFVSFGIAPELAEILPEGATGGKVVLRVHISPDGAPSGFDALMTIVCDLEANPPGQAEVLRLVVPGIVNFNKHVSGANIIVRQ